MNIFKSRRETSRNALETHRIDAMSATVLLSFFVLINGEIGFGESSDPTTASQARNLNNQPPDVLSKAAESSANGSAEQHFYIREYRVRGGGHLVPAIEVEGAVYPYLGPYRTPGDVENARAALEKVYHDKGFQTVQVFVPQQTGSGGIVVLQVVPQEVGRLRVRGSRYFSIDEIKREAPSLSEGTVPNLNDVSKDLARLNQFPDRQVTPSLAQGRLPGTVDVNLTIKDTFPLHGSLEINNRYSASTTPLRLNGSVSYDNLWQLGHSVGGSFQIAPENPNEVKVFSGYYLAHVPDTDWLSLMLEGTKQDSNVSTLGGIGVAGRGDIVGLRAIISLPSLKDFYQSVSLGFDYKHFTQDVTMAGNPTDTPVTYYPFSAAYSGTWTGKGYETDLNSSVIFDARGIGSSNNEFSDNRFGSDASFIYYRGDLSHQRDLPEGFQIYGKAQGQVSDKPLVNSEQFSGGGLGTVRGYLESEELGDNALLGSVELRTPSLSGVLGKSVDEWRFYTFGEGGFLTMDSALPDQHAFTTLASVGAGTRIKIQKYFNGSFDAGVPLVMGVQTHPENILLTFRVWAEF